MLQCFFGGGVFFFIDDIDVESASKYVAGKKLTTVNISVIHIVIMLRLPLPSV